jgi:hypothetical protein
VADPGSESRLATREEAARYLRVSIRTFNRRIAPQLARIPIGSRVFYDREDLDRWLDAQKVGPSTAIRARTSGRSVSASPVSDATARRAREIERKLRDGLLRSSKK